MPEFANHPAEDMFCRLLLHNKLADLQNLKTILGDRANWNSPTFPEELVFRQILKSPIADKVRSAVEAKGLSFPMGFDDPSPADSTAQQNNGTPSAAESAPPKPEGEFSARLLPATTCAPKGVGKELIQILKQARKMGGSDLHLNVGAPVMLRALGQLERLKTPVLTAEKLEAMLFDVLLPLQKDKLLRDLQLDFSLILDDGSRCRSNIAMERNGWTACFRIVPDHIPSFQELGLPPQLKTMTEYPTGLVLVTGPRGAGKTTTLASMIDLINQRRKDHIITVEDPIEFKHQAKSCQVTQRSLGTHTLSFSNALRGALRQDPDVILIGELRDIETISIAITAAETGHLVLASLHTNSAERTIDRLVSSFPPDQQAQIRVMIADSIRGIVCQQLLPRADGQGVVMALEILTNNTSVRKMIVDNRTFQLESVIQTGKKLGMMRMDDSIMELLEKKLITTETAKKYLRNPSVLK